MGINYTEGWFIELDGSDEQYDAIVAVMDAIGVKLHDRGRNFIATPMALSPAQEKMMESWSNTSSPATHGLEKVDFLGAIQRLTTPVKTERELKIEQLKATVEDINQQISELEGECNA